MDVELVGGLIHAWTMGNFPDEHTPLRQHAYKLCACGNLMSEHAERCVGCNSRRIIEEREGRPKDAAMMDRHRRWSACIEAGFTTAEMMAMRPFVFEWEQIVEFAPGVVIRRVGQWVRYDAREGG